jgi:hypothetical protein
LSGGEISGNTADSVGGGVYIGGFGGMFVMSGGKISNNKAPTAGGVLNSGFTAGVTFIMTGGEITGNTAETYCGGLLSADESFDWRGGVISGNKAGVANNDVGNWAIVDEPPMRSPNGYNDEGVDENNEFNSGGDLGVGSDGGGEVEVGSAGKLLDGLFLSVVVVVRVVVGVVVAGLLFYRSKKKQNRVAEKELVGSGVVC